MTDLPTREQFAEKLQGVDDLTGILDEVNDDWDAALTLVAELEKERHELSVSMVVARRQSDSWCNKAGVENARADHYKAALESVISVGDKAAVDVARAALKEDGR